MKANVWGPEQEKQKKNPSVFSGLNQENDNSQGDWLLIIKEPFLDDNPEDCGFALLESFFMALAEGDLPPAAIIFMGRGVSLTCKDSPVLDYLYELEQRKVEIFSSLACLSNYGFQRELCVGKMIGMSGIVSKISHTLRVVTF